MEMWWAQQLLLLIPLLIAVIAFADTVDLKNPDFELPPSNIPANYSTIPLLPLNSSVNSIPGWFFQGSVAYVTNTSRGEPDGILSLPEGSGSHAIYLGDGTINQRIKGTEQSMNYIITFTILGAAQENCNLIDVGSITIALSGVNASYGNTFEQSSFGIGQWETHGLFLGSYGDGDHELLDLTLRYQKSDSVPKNSCRGPIFDSLILNKFSDPFTVTEKNLLVNGGFEMGPASPKNSFNGVLMRDAPNATESPLLQWIINGTVKYINSNRKYLVPEGNAAIELVYGESSGIQSTATLEIGSTYTLDFFIGDANEGCVGKFIVGVQAGSTVKNFTLKSRGAGSTRRFSMTFIADSSVTLISFLSYEIVRTRDFVDCGPVIDDVVLVAYSDGLKLQLSFMVLFSCLVFLVTIL